MSKNIDHYSQTLKSLRRDGTHDWPDETLNKAPYKPLLLLCVLDQAEEEGTLDKNLIKPDTRLSERFGTYWKAIFEGDKEYNLAMPFYHMKNEGENEGFWHLVQEDGTWNDDLTLSSITVPSLSKNLRGAALDKELFELIQKTSCRSRLRRVLIESHFSAPAQDLLYEQDRVNREAYQYGRQLIQSASEETAPPRREADIQVREQGFRQAVAIYAYQHQCAFCDLKIRTPKNYSAVEAAHIIPWSHSQDDDPRNGLGLCRLCHWIFDKGLISVDSEYHLLFSHTLRTPDNELNHIDQLENTLLTLPQDNALNPYIGNLRWHYENKFIKD